MPELPCSQCNDNEAKAVQNGFPMFRGKAPSHCISQGRTGSAPMPFLRSATAATAPDAQDNRGKQQPMVSATIAWQDMDMGRRANEKIKLAPQILQHTSTINRQRPTMPGLVFPFIMSSDHVLLTLPIKARLLC